MQIFMEKSWFLVAVTSWLLSPPSVLRASVRKDSSYIFFPLPGFSKSALYSCCCWVRTGLLHHCPALCLSRVLPSGKLAPRGKLLRAPWPCEVFPVFFHRTCRVWRTGCLVTFSHPWFSSLPFCAQPFGTRAFCWAFEMQKVFALNGAVSFKSETPKSRIDFFFLLAFRPCSPFPRGSKC